MKTKLLAMFFIVALIMSSIAVIVVDISKADNHTRQVVSDYLYDFVVDSYSEYYTIDDWNATIFHTVNNGATVTAEADVEFTKTLKVQSVSELPYMKAVANVQNSLSNSESQANTVFANLSPNQLVQASALVNNEIAFQQSELQQYIGVKQNCTDRFRMSFDAASLVVDDTSLEVYYGVDYFPKEDFIPDTEAVMIRSATDKLSASIAEKTAEPIAKAAVTLPVYHRLTARTYAYTYWQNYNPAFPNQNPNGGDCANYVSQCINAGGIPMDNLWKSTLSTWTVSWVNTGKNTQPNNAGLWRYMTNYLGTSGKQYFDEVLRSQAAAGGFILWKTGYSHVAFIVANDTVTMLYNAHNTNRENASFSTPEFANYDYRFFFSTNYVDD
ncbi:MAG: amidase domain-containing protein [Clostridiales bacterium]|jgi:RNA polymerase sigma-70 factor (ECF subfamily)|nr:amidase domain-containing protein [Clostridiales bacterium]